MRADRTIFCLALLLGSTSLVPAQQSYPMVMSLHPVAAQTGQTSEHVVSARYDLHGAYKIFVTGDGVTGEVVPEEMKSKRNRPPKGTLKIKFIVAADALPGVREFRIATPNGVSTVGQLVIAKDPIAVEKDPNNARTEAQEITLPATV